MKYISLKTALKSPLKNTVSFLAIMLLSLQSLSIQAAKDPLLIAATTGMVADLVTNIGGDKVEVKALMNTGVDPHLYKATQGDLRRILRADIIFYNGLHLEGKMQDIFDKLARKKWVYAVANNLDKNRLIAGENYPDPHIWFDVRLWQLAAVNVRDILIKHDADNAHIYKQNTQSYLAKLDQLHAWAKAQIEQIAPKQRILITAHDAFGYFGQAYGIKVMGLQGISTAAEFGLQDIKRLKDVIVKNQIKAVFVESSVSPRFIQSLVAGVNSEGHQLKIGGELFSDAMGPKDTAEGNYIGMFKHNVNTIVEALK